MLSSLYDSGDDDEQVLVVDAEQTVEEAISLPDGGDQQEADQRRSANQQEPDPFLTCKTDEKASPVKRPMNAYMCWSVEQRKQLKQLKEQNLNIPLPTQEVSRYLGELWRSMTQEEKQPYYDEAEQLRVQHKAMHPDFRYRGGQKRKRKRSPQTQTEEEVTDCIEISDSCASNPSHGQPSQEDHEMNVGAAACDDPCGHTDRQPESSVSATSGLSTDCHGPWQPPYTLSTAGYHWHSPYIFGIPTSYPPPCDAMSAVGDSTGHVVSPIPTLFSPSQSSGCHAANVNLLDHAACGAALPQDVSRIFPASHIRSLYPSWWHYASQPLLGESSDMRPQPRW